MSGLTHTRILVVDDEEDIARLIALLVESNEIAVDVAVGGQEGIDRTLETSPDIILTDLMMPQVDGFALIEKIQVEQPDVPILVITAFASMNTAVKALRLGAFDFLVKPFDKTTVRAAIQRAIQQRIKRKRESWYQHITHTLSLSNDPVKISQTLLTLLADYLKIEYGMIWLADPLINPIPLNQASTIWSERFLDWAERKGLISEEDIPPVAGHIDAITLLAEETDAPGSIIGIPLVMHKRPLGVLMLASDQANHFNEEDLSFLQSLEPFAALAMSNARTYNNLKLTNQRLSAIQSITALTYNARLALDRILRLTVEGIRQNLGYPMVLVCLPNADLDRLIINAVAGKIHRYLSQYSAQAGEPVGFSLSDADNPFVHAFIERQSHQATIGEWDTSFRQAKLGFVSQFMQEQDIRYGIALPLWQSDTVIGVLGIGYTSPSLTIDEQTTLTTIANQVALVIKSASLYQAEQQAHREMEALYRSGLVISSTLSHDEVLTKIVQQIVELTNVESCRISRWDRPHDDEIIEIYLQRTAEGWSDKEAAGTRYDLADRPTVRATLEAQAVRLIKQEDTELSLEEQRWMEENNIQQRLVIPLIIRQQSIGVLELISANRRRHFPQQTIRLAEGLAAQAAIALENARLHEGEVKRIEQEMALAQRIQFSLLPHQPPQIAELSIAARSESARLVGGDFYRYPPLPNNQFGVAIGDVSGKGVPAALFMAIATTAIDTQIRHQSTPGEMLQQLNRMLYPRMQANRMNTGLLIIVFDQDRNEIHVANAGMIAPLIKERDRCDWLDVFGLPLGALEDAHYNSVTVKLEPDSTFVMISDGILEAQNLDGELFGFERLLNSLQAQPDNLSSQEILDGIWTEVQSHLGEAEPNDDMTLVVIQT